MTLARRAKLQLIYGNKDISADLAPFLAGFSYTDHSSGKADDIQINLEDRAGLWRGDWLPEKGATVQAAIITEHWEEDGKTETLPLGTFEIDEIEFSGPPNIVTIKALAIPESSTLRGEVKNRAWEKTQLSVIAQDIANGASMDLTYDTDDDPEYDRIEQTEQSDLEFLLKLCNDAGLSLKITDKQVVVFDDSKYEKIAPVMVIRRNAASVLKYNATSSTRDVYSSCRVRYHNAKTKQDIDYIYAPPSRPTTGKTLVINERVDNLADAEKLAKKRLRQQNKEEVKISMTLLGSLILVGGVTVQLIDWGFLDGKYFVSRADHSSGSGYTTKTELYRVLEGY